MRSAHLVSSAILFAISVIAAAPASAQTTYKCVEAGKVTYTDEPCEDGTVRPVERPGLTATAKQQQEARNRAATETRRADKFVEQARKRADDDARRRAEVAVAEHRAEEARLKKEAAQIAHDKQQEKKMQRSGTSVGFSAKAPQ
jgi:hypothetical protein